MGRGGAPITWAEYMRLTRIEKAAWNLVDKDRDGYPELLEALRAPKGGWPEKRRGEAGSPDPAPDA